MVKRCLVIHKNYSEGKMKRLQRTSMGAYLKKYHEDLPKKMKKGHPT